MHTPVQILTTSMNKAIELQTYTVVHRPTVLTVSLDVIAINFSDNNWDEKLQHSNKKELTNLKLAHGTCTTANLVEGRQVEVPSHVHELNLNPILREILRTKIDMRSSTIAVHWDKQRSFESKREGSSYLGLGLCLTLSQKQEVQ